MRSLSIFLAGFLSLTIVAAAKSPFAGTWEGKINGQPGIDLMIDDVGGKVAGVVVFYFQSRGDDGKWRVADKSAVPLLAPQITGKTLAFEVSHRKTHGSPERGPNVKFRMELTGADEAVLRKVQDQPDAPPVKLIRQK